MKPRNTICLWFDKDALDAARFYAAILTVEFTVLRLPCLGLNGGPAFALD